MRAADMKKLLVVCGPTSSGKTTLALSLAKKFNGELVSADSRQVYRGMDIGTGKDLPRGARLKKGFFAKWGYYETDGIKIWGYDIADPKHEFSVGQYLRFANSVISDIQKRGKLPILVGGTGFYIKGVVDGIATAEVPKNEPLRKNLEERSATELYEKLSQLDSIKAGSLNSSDKKNPRRLIRAIEIAQWELAHGKKENLLPKLQSQDSDLIIGLFLPKDLLEKKIKSRVLDRINAGIKDEVRKLLRNGVKWEDQSMLSLGYKEWRDFFEGAVDEDHVIAQWEMGERNYAKRQMTWFNKETYHDGEKRINWFDITKNEYPENVENLVEKWYGSVKEY